MAMSLQQKPCSRCGRTLPVEHFYVDRRSKGGRLPRCKDCDRARKAEWHKKNPGRRRSHMRNWRRRALYGLSAHDFARLLEAQDFQCAICGREHTDESVLAVDHCHLTQRVRGLLCRPCNSAIGLLGDDLDTVLRAVEYLEAST